MLLKKELYDRMIEDYIDNSFNVVFRAFVKSHNIMIHQKDFYKDIDGSMLNVYFDENGINAEYITRNGVYHDIVLTKETGLRTIEKKAVFEGDIIEVYNEWFGTQLAVVEGYDQGFYCISNDVEDFSVIVTHDVYMITTIYKVVGNVFEDKELYLSLK